MDATPHPMPDKLAWDLFLGPAPLVDYHPVYHPFNWRGWTDWGVGAIGDMGAHLIDHAYWSLELGYPTTIETLSTPYNRASYPAATTTYYEFPARGAKPGVKLTWYDGGLLPPKPEELGAEEVDKGGGVLYVGSKGKLIHETYGAQAAPARCCRQRAEAAADVQADPDVSRDELDRHDSRAPGVLVAVLLRREADRGDAARRGGAQRRQEDPVRPGEPEDRQRTRGRAVPAPAVAAGVVIVVRTASNANAER